MLWKLLVFGACMLFIGGIVGILIASNFSSNVKENSQSGTIAPTSAIDKTSQNYQAGFADARALVENSSLGNFFRMQINKSTITGTVTDIQDNHIKIHDNSTQDDSLNTLFNVPYITDRTIIVDENTKIVRTEESTSAKPQTDIHSYQEVRQINPDGSLSSHLFCIL